MDVRPITLDDVPAAFRLTQAVMPSAPGPPDAARIAAGEGRIAHLAASDPGGCFVGIEGDEVVGVSLSLIREGIWGYSLFALADSHRGRGLGRALFAPAWEYGRGARGHLILSSEHPAAMRLYALSGLGLRPCVAAAGVPSLDRAPDLGRVRDAGPEDFALMDAIGRDVRGAGHGRDLPVLAQASGFVAVEDRAFAAHRGPRVMLVAGRDEEAAALALWGAFARVPRGATVTVDFISAGQDWAVRTCLAAGLALSPDGPLFAGGELGPMRPYLPSGAYL